MTGPSGHRGRSGGGGQGGGGGRGGRSGIGGPARNPAANAGESVLTVHGGYHLPLRAQGKTFGLLYLYAPEILHISPAYLSAQFKKYQKMNFLDCLTELRINAAKELLNDPFRSSAEVASMVGYEDASYFARAFKKRTGVTPTQYRKQAAKAAKDQQEAAL